MRAELGLYRIDDARGAFEDWIKTQGGARQCARIAGKGEPAAPIATTIAARDSSSRRNQACRRRWRCCAACRQPQLQSGAAQLALADLALDGWNYREAVQYAQRALNAGAERAPAQLVLARAYAGSG